jgi:hypothetical protein
METNHLAQFLNILMAYEIISGKEESIIYLRETKY